MKMEWEARIDRLLRYFSGVETLEGEKMKREYHEKLELTEQKLCVTCKKLLVQIEKECTTDWGTVDFEMFAEKVFKLMQSEGGEK